MMSGEDRVSVDDALISTDIDKLIRAISNNKRINVSDLEKETGINRRIIDKWIRVLEDEGYIKIEYNLTNTFVAWLGVIPTDKEEEEREYEVVEEKYTSPFKTEVPKIEQEEPKEVEKITLLEKKELGKPIEDIKDKIIEKMEQSEKSEQEDTETRQEETEHLIENSIEEYTDKREQEVELENKKTINFEELAERVRYIRPKETAEKKKIKELVNSYLDDITRQKAEIEGLKQEKEKLYRNRYMTLENKVEGDMAAITEKVLEKEGRILELKERVLELPDKVDEVEKLHKTMERMEKEGRSIIKGTKDKVNQFLEQIKKSEEQINSKIQEGKEIVEREKDKVSELENIGSSMNQKIDSIKITLEETENTIEQLNESMREMLNKLEDATETKVEISELTNRIRVSVERKEEELEALEGELSEIRKIEQWIMEYVSDYENKIGEVEQYVKNSEEELDRMRESAEGEYIRKYLKELEGLTNMYETELEYATAEERGIEDRIVEAKKRLNELILESKGMIKKLHKESASLEDFEPVVKKAKQKADKVKKTVEEKEKERDRLSEDVRGRKERKKQKAKENRSKDKKGKKK